MRDWLERNWDTTKALEAAGQLPDMSPPEAEASQAEDAPAEEAAAPAEPPERPPLHVARADRWNKKKKKMTDSFFSANV